MIDLTRQTGSALAIDGVPDRIEIIPTGHIRTADRRADFTLTDAAAVIERSMAAAPGGVLLVDFGHGVQGRADRRSDAAGWITGMQVEGDRVMASVEWTPAGADALRNRSYRFISPVFYNRSDREVVLITGAGLVNEPALPQLRQLASKQETDMDDLKQIAGALGLGDDASLDEVLTACRDAKDPASGPVLASILTAAGVEELTPEAGKQICARLTGVPDPSSYVTRAAFDDVTQQLAALQKQVGSGAVEGAIAAAKSEGKLTPAMEGWARQYASADLDGFRTFVTGAPVVVQAGRELTGQPPAGGDGLTELDRQMCAAMGIDPEKFRAEKAKETV